MGASQSKKKTSNTKDLKLYATKHLTSSSTSSQTKRLEQKSTKANQDSRPTTPITMKSNSTVNRISSSLSTDHSIPSPPVEKYVSYHQSNSFFLPKDWETRNYEDNLHFALKTIFGGNVSQAVLPRLKKGAQVIQMGLCTTAWMMDMATQFPSCHFTSIEVAPGSLLKEFPPLPNVTLERGKAPSELLESILDNSVDYIHIRCCASFFSIDQLHIIFSILYRLLKPEGIIIVEDIYNRASGTVMIESFVETLRNIADDNNIDFDFAKNAGAILTEHNFQIVETKKKRVQYGNLIPIILHLILSLGSGGKVQEEFIMFILGIFEDLTDFLAPQLRLDPEDYKHRIEMFCAQCVKNNAHMDWYSWVFKKP